ncbi:sensor histidine kinase [Luteimicrobium sp. DT211]|uniref:sensor histidine kinase n=1 Tax=Luteimicrobium sp. DT211 TaxID=3393412 RepID=UPI003CFAACBA
MDTQTTLLTADDAACDARRFRIPTSAVVGLAAGLAVLSALTVLGASGDGRVALDVVCAVLAVAAGSLVLVAVGRADEERRLTIAAFVLAALAAVSPAATPASTMTTAVVARATRLRVAVPVAVAGAVGHAVQGAWRGVSMGYGWWLLTDVGVHAALLGWGAYGRTRAELLGSLRARVRAAEADRDRRAEEVRREERLRIARDMHDTLAHRLSLVATAAGALAYRPDAPPERLAQAAAVVRDGTSQALVELRQVVAVMRDPDDAVVGVDTLDDLVAQVRAAGADIEVVSTGTVENLPRATRNTVLRAVQECLTNARKHAPGAPVRLEVAVSDDDVRVVATNPVAPGVARPGGVRDDPDMNRGAAPTLDLTGGSRPGVGLVGLRERAATLGGTLDAGADGGTWTVRVVLPLHAGVGAGA